MLNWEVEELPSPPGSLVSFWWYIGSEKCGEWWGIRESDVNIPDSGSFLNSTRDRSSVGVWVLVFGWIRVFPLSFLVMFFGFSGGVFDTFFCKIKLLTWRCPRLIKFTNIAFMFILKTQKERLGNLVPQDEICWRMWVSCQIHEKVEKWGIWHHHSRNSQSGKWRRFTDFL